MEQSRQLFYHLMKPFFHLFFMIRFRFKISSNPLKNLKGPYLVIGHHVTSLDPFFVNIASNRLIRFLAGDANMDEPLKNFFIRFLGMIPFKKKNSDMKSIRNLMQLIKKGHSIGLYPEGGRNWDGITDLLIPSTAKLIKMMEIPVYSTFYRGGYLTKPRWAQYFRRGVIELDCHLLLTSEEIATMTPLDIQNHMIEALDYNEYDWQRQNMIPFKGKKRAEHIQRLLYKCPHCLALGSYTSSNHTFQCKSCKIQYHINTFGFIEGCVEFTDTHQWHTWQKSFIPEIVDQNETYILKNIPYERRHLKTKNLLVDTCDIQINNQFIDIKGKNIDEHLPIHSTFGFSTTLLDLFEFFSNDYKHRLRFDPRKHLPIMLIHDLLIEIKECAKNE